MGVIHVTACCRKPQDLESVRKVSLRFSQLVCKMATMIRNLMGASSVRLASSRPLEVSACLAGAQGPPHPHCSPHFPSRARVWDTSHSAFSSTRLTVYFITVFCSFFFPNSPRIMSSAFHSHHLCSRRRGLSAGPPSAMELLRSPVNDA